MSNGVEVQLPGGIGGKASGSTVIIFIGFLAMAGAILFSNYMLREATKEQTVHFNQRVDAVMHEIERTCGPLVKR